jgi:hypothetical protein
VDWKQKLQSARIFGQQSKETIEKIAQEKIREHWPRIQKLFEEKVGPAALAAAKNEESMRSLFETVYRRLPFRVRMVIKEETFVQFCLKNKDRLVPSGGKK